MGAAERPDDGITVTVIVPAYNEASSLAVLMPSLVSFTQARGWSLIVVDDGSTDGTPALLEPFATHPNVSILRHKVNRGYGGAVKTGIAVAATDLVVTVDADGQHRLEDIDAVWAELRRTGADMVVGNRNAQRSSLYRELGKYLIRRITRILMTLPIRDINSGMRMCRTELARRYLSLCPDSYAFCDVITLMFIHERHLVVERSIASAIWRHSRLSGFTTSGCSSRRSG
jgi:glycosyltransferase involved in cell wall biosynthesis